MTNTIEITAKDVQELATARKIDTTMIRWDDTNEIETVAYVLFNDVSYSEKKRPHTVLANHSAIEAIADKSISEMDDADFEAIAECLNNN